MNRWCCSTPIFPISPPTSTCFLIPFHYSASQQQIITFSPFICFDITSRPSMLTVWVYTTKLCVILGLLISTVVSERRGKPSDSLKIYNPMCKNSLPFRKPYKKTHITNQENGKNKMLQVCNARVITYCLICAVCSLTDSSAL